MQLMMSIAPEQLLHDAVRKNDLDSVRRLVEVHGTDIDCVYYGTTPLLLAVQQGQCLKWSIQYFD